MTTVRVEDDVKRELDRLQGEVLAETGERLSQSQLLARLVRFARAREAAFLGSGDAPWRPPTREEMEAHFRQVEDGPRTDASRIDEALYGGKRRR